MASLREIVRGLVLFLIGRYPFANAVTLLLLLAERADREKYPPLEPKLIYGHLVVFVMCGVCMAFDKARKQAAMVHVGQLLYLGYSICVSERLKYNQWITIRMTSRLVGVAGTIILYAFFTSRKPRSPHLRKMGELLVGIYLMCLTYMLVESQADRKAFMLTIPGGDTAVYICALLLAAATMCYVPGLFVYDITQMLVFLIPFYTLCVDCNFDYWTRRQGMDFWNQARLAIDNLFIFLGMVMYLTCTKKQIYTKED